MCQNGFFRQNARLGIHICVVLTPRFQFLDPLYGFLFYIVVSGVLGLYYLLSEATSDAVHFLNKQQLVTGFVAENLFTYILVWTLMYGCVHVY